MGSIEKFDFQNISKSTAILCRNNGEAEYVSHILREKYIPHILLRSVNQTASLKRYIADCLWDFHADSKIAKNTFIERYCSRVSNDINSAQDAFNAISEAVYNDIKDYVEIEKLAQTLCTANKLPSLLLNEDNVMLTVSTIHKAKGREFDTVYLLNSGFSPDEDNTEEARVWYVGCTRAKSELYRLDKKYKQLKRSSVNNQRWMQLNNHRIKWSQKLLVHCRNIVLGLPKDFSETGFASEDFDTALRIQQYIAENVHINDDVEIILNNDKYQILHKGTLIGCLGEDMLYQLHEIAKECNPVSGIPPYLSAVYVSNIVTITPRKFAHDVPSYFRESRFWLGVELSGFPKIDWYYEVNK